MEEKSTSNGIINKTSSRPVVETIDRLEALVISRGMKVFARIDQKAAAESAGLTMRPTLLLIFGDPKSGTPLMIAHPSLALDLPLKALAWQDDSGQVWVAYNSPQYLVERHGLPNGAFQSIEQLIDVSLS
jgi:uncharacterized protein (DUF302 family)